MLTRPVLNLMRISAREDWAVAVEIRYFVSLRDKNGCSRKEGHHAKLTIPNRIPLPIATHAPGLILASDIVDAASQAAGEAERLFFLFVVVGLLLSREVRPFARLLLLFAPILSELLQHVQSVGEGGDDG